MQTSFPKNKIKVLLLENIHAKGIEAFDAEGYQVESLAYSLPEAELTEKIKDVHILGTRSKTRINLKILNNASKLWTIGAYCIGTNHVDLDACLEQGTVVFNAPYSNTRSVVELALGEIIVLMRKITDKSKALHQGQWDKSVDNCYEVRGKKLGIIGYGNIGAQLSVLAEALGMQVYFYDIAEKLILGNANKCQTLAELLKISDIVTVHVDGRKENKNLISTNEFASMRPGSYFLNLSRGSIVDIPALVASIKSGHLHGAGLDVFPEEPHSNNEPFYNELQNLPNVILTPHIGGNTLEAQQNIATFVSQQIINYINSGDSLMSVNFPELKLPKLKNAHRMIHIHRNTPGVLAYINELFASHKINILGQYLKTNEKVGYVITDVSKEYDPSIIDKIRDFELTLRFRVLY